MIPHAPASQNTNQLPTMKTFLFGLITLITLAVAAPVAQAGQFARVYTKHGPVYLHKSQLYGGNYYGSNYSSGSCHKRYSHRSSHHRSYYAQPSYYSRPVYYSRSNYGYSHYSHYQPSCGYRSSPRISFSFGF